MKKILIFAVALVAMAACNSGKTTDETLATAADSTLVEADSVVDSLVVDTVAVDSVVVE